MIFFHTCEKKKKTPCQRLNDKRTARHRIDRDGSGDITIEDILAFLKEADGVWILRDFFHFRDSESDSGSVKITEPRRIRMWL